MFKIIYQTLYIFDQRRLYPSISEVELLDIIESEISVCFVEPDVFKEKPAPPKKGSAILYQHLQQ